MAKTGLEELDKAIYDAIDAAERAGADRQDVEGVLRMAARIVGGEFGPATAKAVSRAAKEREN